MIGTSKNMKWISSSDVYNKAVCGGGAFLLIDTRTVDDYAAGHMPEALNLPQPLVVAESQNLTPGEKLESCLSVADIPQDFDPLRRLQRRRLLEVIMYDARGTQDDKGSKWLQDLAKLFIEDGLVLSVYRSSYAPFFAAFPFLCTSNTPSFQLFKPGSFFPNEIIPPVLDENRQIVKGGLYLAGFNVALNLGVLNVLQIRRVVDASTIPDCKERWAAKGVKYMTITVNDKENADIQQYFAASTSFTLEGINAGEGVLIHCMAGASRSAALVLAFLMKTHDLTLPVAYDLVYRKRALIIVNMGFRRQLAQWQLHCRPQDGIRVPYTDDDLRRLPLCEPGAGLDPLAPPELEDEGTSSKKKRSCTMS